VRAIPFHPRRDNPNLNPDLNLILDLSAGIKETPFFVSLRDSKKENGDAARRG